MEKMLWTACLLLFFHVGSAAEQENADVLLPPAALNSSAAGAEIREALAAGDLALAQKKIEELAARKPRNFEPHYWAGYLALRQRRYYQAIRKLRQAEALSANPAVLKLLALSYYLAHQNRLFLLKMREAQQKEPADFGPYYYLGRYYDSEMSDFKEAARYFQQALARQPDRARSHYYLGHCLEVEQKPDQAEAEYRKAIELAERKGATDGLGYQGLARLRLSANQPAQALPFAKRAVALGPRDSAAHKLLARAYSDLGSTAEAAAEWKLSSELDPTDAPALYRLYRCYVSLGEDEKSRAALAEYKRIAALYGTN
jgi:tetratricopeptide (TPR) repeat protein